MLPNSAVQARAAFNAKGFVAINGKTLQGKAGFCQPKSRTALLEDIRQCNARTCRGALCEGQDDPRPKPGAGVESNWERVFTRAVRSSTLSAM